METPYRAAIIGTGRIASTYDDEIVHLDDRALLDGQRHSGLYAFKPIAHAGAYRSVPGYDLVAAANRSWDKLATFGERWGVRALYTSYAEMLAREKPDVVSVCTQSPEKVAAVIAAAEAGAKAVLVEKAMATSLAEADAMLDACRTSGTLLAVNHPYRFSPLLRRCRDLITGGAIGELGCVAVYSGGGTLHIGTHTFDLLRFWAGDVVEIYARMPTYEAGEDRPAAALVRFASGVTGLVDQLHRLPPGFEARGESGYLIASMQIGDGRLVRFEKLELEPPTRWTPDRSVTEPIDTGPHTLSTTQRLLVELRETLERGTPFISTGEDGAKALELGIACHLSHRMGRPVGVPLEDRTLRVVNR